MGLPRVSQVYCKHLNGLFTVFLFFFFYKQYQVLVFCIGNIRSGSRLLNPVLKYLLLFCIIMHVHFFLAKKKKKNRRRRGKSGSYGKKNLLRILKFFNSLKSTTYCFWLVIKNPDLVKKKNKNKLQVSYG